MEENSQLTSDSTSSEEEDFFKPLKSSQAQQGPAVLDGYLTCAGDDMGVLKSFPPLLKLSLRLNTLLPASAACEWLFSSAGLIFSPKRARISFKKFVSQLWIFECAFFVLFVHCILKINVLFYKKNSAMLKYLGIQFNFYIRK